MKALLVDDEPIARQILREELERFPEVQLVGEAGDGKEALHKIAELQPDLVFLDIQLPLLSGCEVVWNLQPPLPIIIIVTAFDEHAIRAFEAGAIDYLLKPVSEERLRRTMERVGGLHGRPSEIATCVAKIGTAVQPSGLPANRRVVGRTGHEYHILDLQDILAFQAERELVWIITSSQRLLATQTLHALEERLENRQFQRVHRNAIVNVQHIRKMRALSSQRWLITLSNALELTVSKRQAHNIRDLMRR